LRSGALPGEYLAFLSVKYEVDPDEFFYALNSAWEKRRATCGELLIQCRGETRDNAIFLILRDSEVVAQFPIPKGFLSERGNTIKNFMKTDMIRRHLVRKNRGSHCLSIRDLRTGMRQVSLRAKVLEIPRPKLVFTRFGNYASVADALIEDETGKIKLCLWNEQIESVSNGDTIQIENGRTSTFKGERQLSIGKNGTLSLVSVNV
jgi:replication factor A1